MATTTERLLAGTVAGVIATVPMSALMLLWHRNLPRPQRYPLPPRKVTMEAAEDVGLKDELTEEQRMALTVLGHFGYGGGVGGLYALLPTERTPLSPVTRGIAYGLAVWTGSYLGWLPLAGWHPPATEEPARRNALMIAAHVVFGGALGALTDSLLQMANDRRATSYPVARERERERQRATNAS